ncbi:MAG: mechanosensitive ion channel protein MscS, partial [Novosphingobium sp.]
MNTFKQQIADVIRVLNEIGFDLGTYHISVWGALRIVIVMLLVIVAAQLIGKLARRMFRRLTSLDRTQQLL